MTHKMVSLSKVTANVIASCPRSLQERFEQKLSTAMHSFNVLRKRRREARKNFQLLSHGNPTLTSLLEEWEVECEDNTDLGEH